MERSESRRIKIGKNAGTEAWKGRGREGEGHSGDKKRGRSVRIGRLRPRRKLCSLLSCGGAVLKNA